MPTVYRSSCSDPLTPEAHERWAQVESWLVARGESVGLLAPGVGPWDAEWWLVADPTGGSLARESLPLLVGALPTPSEARSRRAWWSMSDNALVLNALVDRGLCRLFHGHPLSLAGREAEAQRQRFEAWSGALQRGEAFPAEVLPRARPLRNSPPSTLSLLGGNLTALERLGDTPWRPRPLGRFLLLESLSCPATQAPHRVAALLEDPWWEGIGGLVLGRFTQADRDPTWLERCLSLLPPNLPVLRLPQVGHGADGYTVPLGEPLTFSEG